MSRGTLFSQKLPSHLYFYEPFEKNDVENCTDDSEQNIQSAFSTHCTTCTNPYKIKDAICFVSGLKPYKQYPYYDDRWNFLYYWIGQQIWSALQSETDKENQFKDLLKKICELIKSKCSSQECKINCELIDKDIFQHKKIVFDFSHNYNSIKGYFGEERHDCNEKWHPYKQEITKACSSITAYCAPGGAGTTNGGDPYCEKFKDTYKFLCTGNLRTLKCKTKSELHVERCQECPCKEQELKVQKLSHELSEAHANSRSATTSTALSSIFGTLATIGAPFLLYKTSFPSSLDVLSFLRPVHSFLLFFQYKPWSSWFGNHSSGNGRNGRSTRRKGRSTGQNFGSSTEDSLTEYSTDNSTIDEAVSSATRTRVSTNREGRTGTNTPGHHQNIVYGRMNR
ncbi:KIR-like protein [Plasmodium coatneyi]|uniref:KIR-like protein n=1 Tax=Plasmodium coatneyi TaxID=208452 RepID=A0A1B1DZK2_9APIC|nr:KIR-like protein [Plasmodium coatneyi]ANQ08045.1 KIR-like protein [Plasmodium coatneyi]